MGVEAKNRGAIPVAGRSLRVGISRREFLKLGGAGIAGTALLGASACASGSSADLTFTFWGSTFEKQAVEKMVQKFEGSHPEIRIDPQLITGDYDAKMNTLVAANNAPDVAYMGSGMAMRLAEGGKLVNIAQYVDKYAQLQDRLPQTNHYWAPGKMVTNTAVEMMLLWYSKTAFKEAGVEFPPAKASKAWTWDRFVETAQKLTIDQSGNRADESGFDPENIKQFGVSGITSFWPGWYSLLISNGGAITNEDGTKYVLNSPEAIRVFQNLQDLIHKYHVAPSPAQQQSGNQATTMVQMQTRRVAMAIDGQWALLDMAQSDLDYGMAVLPKFEEPKTVVLSGASVIFESSKYPEKALDFYLYHNDPRHVDLFSDGLWMPLEKKYYTDPRYISKWIDNEAHPPEYKTAVIDYTLNNSEPEPTYNIKNYDRIDPKLTSAIDLILLNKKSAKEALDDLEKEVQPLLQGLYMTG